MKKEIHKAGTRGHADHGWLNTHHTFSFAHYHNPDRMHFGKLRVLNDDIVAPQTGFGMHPHDNMEIVSIVLDGELTHRDNMGNVHVIRTNDVQIMSAGTGVMHAEKNEHPDNATNFLQIWVYPDKRNIDPRYGQRSFDWKQKKNQLVNVIAPSGEGDALQINQEAWFYLSEADECHEKDYSVRRPGNGVYLFILEGRFAIDGTELEKRDGIGIHETDHLNIKALSSGSFLLMDVPMN